MMQSEGESVPQTENFLRSLMNVALFFREELGQLKFVTALFLFLTLLTGVIDFMSPFFSEKMIDIAIPGKKLHLIALYSFYIVSSLLAAYVLELTLIKYSVRIKEKIVFAMREKMVRRILSKDPAFFNQFNSADILTRFANDLHLIGDFFYDHLLCSVVYFITALAFIGWLFYLNWLLAACSCSIFLIHIIAAAVFYGPIVRRARFAQDRNSEQNDCILDIINGETDIRIYQQKTAFMGRFHRKGLAYTNAEIKALFLVEAVWGSLERLSIFTTVIPVIAGAFLICFNFAGITIGLLIAFSQLMFYCTKYISYITYTSVKSSSIAASIDRVNELLDRFPEKKIPPISIEETPDSANMEFRNVSFAYPAGKMVFKNLNLFIKGGERVAIMAPSGFGKTTLSKLLLCLCEPSSGTILFGGKDIHSYPLNFYLSFLSYVCHDTHIFTLSVRENIEMGWTVSDSGRLEKQLRSLHIHDYIDALPDKADTVLNAKGVSLSVGQKQRIALARALIREPQVIILDEFTSALDRGTEEQILDDLFSIMGKESIICITHSQNVAARMDRIIYLPDVSG